MVKNLRGFTLVEVLAVMAIFLLLLAGVYSFFISGQKLFLSGSRQTDLHGSVRL
ncbi:MAG: PilW family protein, partial [Bacillota bacterium]